MVLWRAPQSHRPRAGPRGPILTPRQEVDGFQSGLPHALFQHSLLTQGMGRFGTCDDTVFPFLTLLPTPYATSALRLPRPSRQSPQSTVAETAHSATADLLKSAGSQALRRRASKLRSRISDSAARLPPPNPRTRRSRHFGACAQWRRPSADDKDRCRPSQEP